MSTRLSTTCAALLAVLVVAAAVVLHAQNIKPRNGYVPDESTAVAIGEAVMVPIWGAAAIAKDRPYRATLTNGVWRVEGIIPPNTAGGTAVVLLARDDGRILRAFHEQ